MPDELSAPLGDGQAPNLAAYPPEVLNTVADAIRASVATVDGFLLLSQRFHAAAHVLNALRQLPVEQRMDAMGMTAVRASDAIPAHPVYVEAVDVAPY